MALLFPCAGAIAAKREEEDRKIQTDGQERIDPGVFWMKQTARLFLPLDACRFAVVALTR